MRRSTYTATAVTYGSVGGTQAVDLMTYPPEGYRPAEASARLGSGDERFEQAVALLMTWGVQRGSGIEVTCVMPSLVATELASGVADSPFVKRAKPEDVAEALVAALQVPRFDVFVPKSTGYITQFMAAMPRSVREATARAFKADRLLIDAAHGHGRAAYEARAAASAPAAEAIVEEKAAA